MNPYDPDRALHLNRWWRKCYLDVYRFVTSRKTILRYEVSFPVIDGLATRGCLTYNLTKDTIEITLLWKPCLHKEH